MFKKVKKKSKKLYMDSEHAINSFEIKKNETLEIASLERNISKKKILIRKILNDPQTIMQGIKSDNNDKKH